MQPIKTHTNASKLLEILGGRLYVSTIGCTPGVFLYHRYTSLMLARISSKTEVKKVCLQENILVGKLKVGAMSHNDNFRPSRVADNQSRKLKPLILLDLIPVSNAGEGLQLMFS